MKEVRQCVRWFLAPALVALAAAAARADGGEELHSLLGQLRQVRAADLAALRASVAADEAKEPAADIRIALPDFLEYDPNLAVQRLRPATIVVHLKRRGGRWVGAVATGWSESDHQADASGLTWSQGALAGTLRIRFDPRGERTQGIYYRPLNYDMIPTQRKPFTIRIALDLKPAGEGKLVGTYRRAAQEGFPEAWDACEAEVRPAPAVLFPDPPPEDGTGRELAALWRHVVALDWLRRGAGWWDEIAPHLAELEPSAGGPDQPAALADLARRALAALADRAARPDLDCLTGPGGCDDPDFGPWFAREALPTGASADGVLPDDAGGDGPEEWRFISRWHVLAPLVWGLDLRTRPAALAPVLADPRLAMRDSGGAEYAWREVGPPSDVTVQTIRSLITRIAPPWTDPLADREGHSPRAPRHPPRGQPQSFLAAADVESPRDGTLWLGTAMFCHGAAQRLYLNERLVWESARVDEPGNVRGALVRANLRRGSNRLLVFGAASRYNNVLNPFLAAFCIRGAPRSAAQVEEDKAKERAARAAAEGARRDIRGFHTDWRGQHPDADPVRAWDLEKGINVLWRRTFPEHEAADESNVVVVGRKVLVVGYPHVLTCLDADTGAVLWRRIASRFELLDPALAEEAERVRIAAEKARVAVKEGTSEEERARLRAEIASYDPSFVEEAERAQIEAEKARAAAAASMPEEEKVRLRERVARWQALLERLDDPSGRPRRKATWHFPWYHKPCWTTPVTDGRHVWVKFGTGVAACYDLGGDRRWMVATGNPIVGERCNPVLVDGLLVLMLPRRWDPNATYVPEVNGVRYVNAGVGAFVEGDLRAYELVALDAATGRERWRTPVLAGDNEGSPVVAYAARGDEVLPVIVTPLGTVVRAEDGKVLYERGGIVGESYQTPYGLGDRLCWTTHCSSMVSGRLVMRDRDHVAVAPAWLSLNTGLTQMQQCGVYTIGYDDRIAVMNARLGVSNALGSQEAAVMDVETGDVVHRIQFVFHSAGKTYTNHAAARDVVFLGQYEKVSALPPPFYNWAVCSQGDRPRVLALNTTPLTKAPPVFVGDRAYFRCKNEVICLGRAGAEGAAYERRRLAEHFLKATVPPRPWPDEQPPVDVAADSGPVAEGVPVWPVSASTAPGRWLFAGPFPAGSKPLADPGAARLAPGQTLTAGDIQRQVADLDPKFIEAKQETKFWRGNMQYVEGTAIDFPNAVGRKADSLAYYYAVLRATRPCVVRLAVRGGSNVESWLSGQHITRDDGLYRLAPGHHPWLIAVTLRQVPPVPGVCIRPSLIQVPDYDRAMDLWRRELKTYQADLERLAAEDPKSDAAAAAQRLLRQIDGTAP